ncbi:MAG: hypothetical protein L0220_02860 [Acidobacteria bacterium]|nr:hypothetical protein [Acidobacteriota bacterium]
MTKAEYTAFEERFAGFMWSEKLASLHSTGIGEEFSSRPCECCGSHLAGSRERMVGLNSGGDRVGHYWVCCDCMTYAEFGQLDDLTMLSIDDER